MNEAFMLRAADSMLWTPNSTAYFSAMAPLSGIMPWIPSCTTFTVTAVSCVAF